MKTRSQFLAGLSAAALSSLALSASAIAAPETWEIDQQHSVASFSVKHMMVSTVRGELGKVSGTLVLDKDDPSKSNVDATIDVKGLTTREADRDKHLNSPDFFDSAKYPTATFKSTKVEKAGDGKLKVSGDLTLRGVTKPVVLEVDGPSAEVTAMGKTKTGFSATTKLNRKDFGVSWNKNLDGGGLVVSDDVKVQLDVELNKAGAPAAAAKK